MVATLTGAIPELTFDEATRLIERKGEVVPAIRELLLKLAREKPEPATPPPPPVLPDLIALPFGFEAPRIIADGEVVKGSIMLARAKEANAVSGKTECEDFLAHQDEIPVELRGKVVFVFAGWQRPDDSGIVAIVYWDVDRWVQDWGWLGRGWRGRRRPVRRSA